MDFIDFDAARQGVTRLARKDPERTASCNYLMQDDEGDLVPCCIVGQYLYDEGFEIDVLKALGTTRIDMLHTDNLIPDEVLESLRFTKDALDYLGLVQEFQDGGDTWWDSVRRADVLRNNTVGIPGFDGTEE